MAFSKFANVYTSLNHSLSKRFRLIIVFIATLILYFTIYLNPKLLSVFSTVRKGFIEKYDRDTCCMSLDSSKDICDRLNCTSPSCPTPQTLNQLDEHNSYGQNAFFIETSGSGALNIRQAFSVESLAFHNPNLNVKVLFMDDREKPINRSKVTEIGEKLKEKYNNIQFLIVDLDEYMAGTSMEKWYHCTDWRKGQYRVAHLSDGLRLLTLHKYGGYYFDLDIIFVKPVTYFRNFVASEWGDSFCNNAIHADYGHPLMQLALQDFYLNYKRDAWAHNGPALLVRVMKSFCGVEKFNEMNYVSCRGFMPLPSSTFNLINWNQWQSFFSQRPANETQAPSWITKQVVGVHIWNHANFDVTAYKNSTQEYVRIVRDNCPVIFSIAPETF